MAKTGEAKTLANPTKEGGFDGRKFIHFLIRWAGPAFYF
jgi:hypothetical protein